MTHHPYRDQVVVITGASSGIGEALAYQLADQGARLALAARRRDNLETIAARCRATGAGALVIQADVSEQAQCERIIAGTIAAYGRLDMLINNAGITMWARFGSLADPALIERIMRVNFLGAMYCTYYALPHLKQTRGRIVCVSSLAGKIYVPGNTGYIASKYAMDGFFNSLRGEIEDDGVSVTLVYPDFVATDLPANMLDASGQPSKGVSETLSGSAMMSAETCARIILDVSARRKPEELMSRRGKLFPWLKLIAPGLIARSIKKLMAQTGI
jgi:short-subunit dehydrogenase